jgi:acetoin utilization protein AcuC
MSVALIEHPDVTLYRFSDSHPLRPERVTLTLALMRAWGLIREPDANSPAAISMLPPPAEESDLLLVHAPEYIAAVRRAGEGGGVIQPSFGIGHGDTPPFPHMHEAAALAVGGTIHALEAVLSGEAKRAHNPAGGLHHAHRNRASGFCVYNDCAVAIERAIRNQPGLRVAYVDIDAHHGDGVEAAFESRPDVLTVSVHESGSYLFPRTGHSRDIGTGEGTGFALNVPLPPWAGPEEYALVAEEIIAPGLQQFSPDVIVLQAGADSHRNDPLTHLFNSVAGYDATVRAIIGMADGLCDGRIVITGGGGYDTFSAVPRMWACALAALLGVDSPGTLPDSWLAAAEEGASQAGVTWRPVRETFSEWVTEPPDATQHDARNQTLREIARLRERHPLLT